MRSSTNAEDLPGFSGAGLYESVILAPRPSREAVASAIRRVWGSTFSDEAVLEREAHGIDHGRVAMAILVQPMVEPAVANGVAISRNPFDESRPAVYVNVQVAGTSVTDARAEELPEMQLIHTAGDPPQPEILSRSSLIGGVPILDEDEARSLATTVMRIHDRLVPSFEGEANAVDVEFLQSRDGGPFVVVQARAITIRRPIGNPRPDHAP